MNTWNIMPQLIPAFTYLKNVDLISLLHPAIAVAFVFPIIGIVANFSWQTRQRRLAIKRGEKSKIPPRCRARTRPNRTLAYGECCRGYFNRSSLLCSFRVSRICR